MEHISDLDRGVFQNWYQVLCVQHTFWASPKPHWIWELQGRQLSPLLGICPSCPHGRLGVSSPREVIG